MPTNLIPVADALARVIGAIPLLPAEQVPVAEALGRVVAETVVSRRTQPPADVSAMDGYAVRVADVREVPATLTHIGESAAGSAYGGSVGAGKAVRIFTGAPVPAGADCIIIQEDTEADGDRVIVKEAGRPGRHIRLAGLDFRDGDVGIEAGTLLTARHLALAAAMNRPWLAVRQRPRVAILATGDEIVMPGDPIGESQIVSSNSLALAAVVSACGADPVVLGIAPDDADTLGAMAEGATGNDMLVTTGGVSVGDHDLVAKVLGEQGLNVDFWRIAMRPGKPLLFGNLLGTPFLGLPGNPVSALVCALVFLRPSLIAMQGMTATDDFRQARLAAPLRANDQRQDYLRAKLRHGEDGALKAEAFTVQDSSMLSALAGADALILRPPHAPAAEAGDVVDVLMFPGGVVTF
ncbi:MAG TPA: gephyrin-like molybdotransferase Glp [Alphaproteobacteria bacterium]|jgi:molybdopterin molybdotransferase|nr:gephyrin-like molybdotransferase Glp [Alphaproteobacteria bacterium]